MYVDKYFICDLITRMVLELEQHLLEAYSVAPKIPACRVSDWILIPFLTCPQVVLLLLSRFSGQSFTDHYISMLGGLLCVWSSNA